MQVEEFKQLIQTIDRTKSESTTLELKKAQLGAPEKIYDTLSAFANTKGGIIVYGIDEANSFAHVGVYDINDLQRKVSEQCLQMQPEVHAIFTPLDYEGKKFLAVEIPECDQNLKPCFYKGKGRLTGSYLRIGDQDVQMNEYEIYNLEAFKNKTCDELRIIDVAVGKPIETVKLQEYLLKIKMNRPNLENVADEAILELNGLTKNGQPSLLNVLMFSLYPQAILPNLSIIAVVVPGTEIGDSEDGVRFIANKRIEGTLTEMIDGAIDFAVKNMSVKTVINPQTGKRSDITEYPIVALREAILNAVIHRDYSTYTENQPITIYFFKDRVEITNPGGLYGRLSVEDLGRTMPDTRNPNIAKIMELYNYTENRYSGIPIIKSKLQNAGLPEPVFENYKGIFKVTFYNSKKKQSLKPDEIPAFILNFCKIPRSIAEIMAEIDIKTAKYLKTEYLQPLINNGSIAETIPDKPKSKYQKYVTKLD